MPTRFTQPCPTCGRHMRISVELLGREVACQHCHAEFVAGQDDGDNHSSPHREQVLMQRVEEILRKASHPPEWIAEPLSTNEMF